MLNTTDLHGVSHLLDLVDAFIEATNVNERTLSFRIFGDNRKLGALREGADITTGRYNAAVLWIAMHAPVGEVGSNVRRLLAQFECRRGRVTADGAAA